MSPLCLQLSKTPVASVSVLQGCQEEASPASQGPKETKVTLSALHSVSAAAATGQELLSTGLSMAP